MAPQRDVGSSVVTLKHLRHRRNCAFGPTWSCLFASKSKDSITPRSKTPIALASDAVAMDDAFRCRSLQVVASPLSAPSGLRVGQSGPSDFIRCESRHTGPVGSCSWLCECTHPVRCRIPKCTSAVAATLPAPPAALSPVYTDVVRRESMAFTTLIGNFVEGNLSAAVSAENGTIVVLLVEDQAPATIYNGLHPDAPDCNLN